MANPVFIDCPANDWKKVATAVVGGNIRRKDVTPYEYLQMYVATGDPAPSGIDEGIPAFEDNSTEPISASEEVDVYIYAFGANGRVRADL